MSGKMAREKGKRGERMLAKELNRLFDAQTRRGKQYCGDEGHADVVGLPGIYIEAKNKEKTNLRAALEQAKDEAGQHEDNPFPIVFHKRNGKPWTATMYLNDLPMIARLLKEK